MAEFSRTPRPIPQFANRSYWIDSYGEYQANSPVTEPIKVDVAVIGGGFTGLSTAWNIKQLDSGTDVAVLEQEIIGFGASGRNAGWVVPEFGLDQASVAAVYGMDRMRQAYRYSSDAIRYVTRMVEEHSMNSDLRFTGQMRIAFGANAVKSLVKIQRLYERLDVGHEVNWLDRKTARQEINSPHIQGALFEPSISHIDPCKHVREWKRLAESSGATVYENTPAISIEYTDPGVRIQTPRGDVIASKIVIATNGYTHLLEGPIGKRLRRDQASMWPQNSISEPLTEQQWADIGWAKRCPIKGTGNLFHNMAPSADGRILMSFPHLLGCPKGREMNHDFNAPSRDITLAQFRNLFPSLADLKFSQTWGGPISSTVDLLPHVGFMGDERVAYSTGCWGHGVALSQQNGRTLADLVLNKKTERTECWFVNRKPRRWPLDPFGFWGRALTIGLMRWIDKRNMAKDGIPL